MFRNIILGDYYERKDFKDFRYNQRLTEQNQRAVEEELSVRVLEEAVKEINKPKKVEMRH